MKKYLLLLLLLLILSLKQYAQRSDFVHINFKKADSIAKQLKGASLNNLPVLVHKLTSQLTTDVEKFRAIYTWVCFNIENDYSNHLQNLKKRRRFQNDSMALTNWNTEFKERALKKLIKHKKTICTGYAYLLKELSSLAGLNCKMVHGYGRTVSSNVEELSIPNHSWNVVQLNNKWYLSDPTWASGFFHYDDGRFVAQYNDGYFLTEPELFVKSHYPLDTQWILIKANTPTIEDFLTGPLVYGNAFKYGIKPIEPLKIKLVVNKNERLSFKYEVSKDLNNRDISLVIGNNISKNIVKTMISEDGETIFQIDKTFRNRGLFDVHIMAGDDVVISYTVKVFKARNK